MKAFVCGTSTSEDREVAADDMEDAAMRYAQMELDHHPGAFAAVWVRKKDEPKLRSCVTTIIPGACPFETEQFKSFIRWLMIVTWLSGNLAWNKAINMIVRVDMGFEITPGVVPISLSDRETSTGKMETFEWKLAGYRHQSTREPRQATC